MEETREQQGLYRYLQFGIYLSAFIEIFLYYYIPGLISDGHREDTYQFKLFAGKLFRLPFYSELVYSKLFTLLLICLVSVGTLSRKKRDLDPKNHIVYPLTGGLLLLFSAVWFHAMDTTLAWPGASWSTLAYLIATVGGTILIHVAMDNVSKMISSKLGKDKWNVEGESFMQQLKPSINEYSVNIPTLFYYKGKVHKGWINLVNIFRGTMVIGTPGSGKTFGVINPAIRQLIAKEFCLCIYDFKNPDLGKIAYYHYLLAKSLDKCEGYGFHVINLTEVEKSRRINPWRREYLASLADASETAEALVESLKKGEKPGGSDQFFTQSAVNFLAACIYFFSRHQDGKYSSLPHVLAFLNLPYEDIFETLFSEVELVSLLSPFKTAWQAKAYDQLEGQIGTLKIFISRLATKETFWVFSGDDIDLKISDPKNPGVLILANDPGTQQINSTCYSVVLNRLVRLVNSKGNLPCGIIVDEVPTLFMHRIENLIATARSNRVAVMMGLQELPQFKQQYGREAAATITSVVGNVISGSVRNKETLDWLERLFGKVKQMGESLSIDRNKTSVSLSEKLEPLIPAGKIASLKSGEVVGMLAGDVAERFTGDYQTTAIHCRIDLDMELIAQEENSYRDLPTYYDFGGRKEQVLRENFLRISEEVRDLVKGFKKKPADIPPPQVKGTMRNPANK